MISKLPSTSILLPSNLPSRHFSIQNGTGLKQCFRQIPSKFPSARQKPEPVYNRIHPNRVGTYHPSGTGLEPITSKSLLFLPKKWNRLHQASIRGFHPRFPSQVSIQTPSNSVPKWNRFHREVHPLHSIEFRLHLSGTGFIQASIQAFFPIQMERVSSK